MRESDSGARPLHHTRSGNLSGSPRDPGQVSRLPSFTCRSEGAVATQRGRKTLVLWNDRLARSCTTWWGSWAWDVREPQS